jgi:hypothetical protein
MLRLDSAIFALASSVFTACPDPGLRRNKKGLEYQMVISSPLPE